MILDAEWEGSPGASKIKEHITSNLIHSGWKEDRCQVIVIDPELENWIWQRNDHVAKSLGLDSANDFPRLIDGNTWPNDQAKPVNPKETLEGLLRQNRIPRSSAIYKQITSKVSVGKCQDSSFQELQSTLHIWFPIKNTGE